jgi:hypothetical protein
MRLMTMSFVALRGIDVAALAPGELIDFPPNT